MKYSSASEWPDDLVPRPRVLSPSDTREEAREHAKAILETQAELRELVDKHGRAMETRWMKNKRDEKKRIDLLSKIHPDIPRRRLLNKPRVGTPVQDVNDRFRKACLVPNINLACLVVDDVILRAILNRANVDPWRFVKMDIQDSGIDPGNCTQPDANGYYAMMLINERTPEGYGAVVPVEKADLRRAFSIETGLLVLEAQRHIYGFFLRFAKEILDADFKLLQDDPKGTMRDVTAMIAQPTLSLSQTILRATYQPPASNLLQSLESLARSELTAQIDYLAGLREDPKSFAEALIDAENLLVQKRESITIAGSMLRRLMGRIFILNYVSLQFKRLVKLDHDGELRRHSGGFTETASIIFQALRLQIRTNCAASLKASHPPSVPRPSMKGLSREREGLFLELRHIYRLIEDLPRANQRKLNGLPNVAFEIQQLVADSPGLLASIEQPRQRALSELCFHAEFHRQIQLLKPDGARYSKASTEAAEVEKAQVSRSCTDMMARIVKYCNVQSLNPYDDMFRYPNTPKTDLSKQRRRSAKEAVDGFYSGLDRALEHDTLEPVASIPQNADWHAESELCARILEGPFVEARNIAVSNRDHLEERETFDANLEAENDASNDNAELQDTAYLSEEADEDNRNENEDSLRPLPVCDVVKTPGDRATSDVPKRFAPVKVKNKIKTVGESRDDIRRPVVNDHETEREVERIEADPKARELLQIAFKCHKGKPPGEFDFDRLLLMMRALGFQTTWTGRSYCFKHPEEPIPISLHSPHAVSRGGKLQLGQFFNFVVRLKKQYSWFEKEHYDLND